MPTIRSLFATLLARTTITGRLIRSLFATLNVDTYHYSVPTKPVITELQARQSLTSSLLGRTVTTSLLLITLEKLNMECLSF
jgi:hypothetical protein